MYGIHKNKLKIEAAAGRYPVGQVYTHLLSLGELLSASAAPSVCLAVAAGALSLS